LLPRTSGLALTGGEFADSRAGYRGEIHRHRGARLGILDFPVDAVALILRLALDVALRGPLFASFHFEREVDVAWAAGAFGEIHVARPFPPRRRAGILPAGCRGFQPRVREHSTHRSKNLLQGAQNTGALETCPTSRANPRFHLALFGARRGAFRLAWRADRPFTVGTAGTGQGLWIFLFT